MKKVIAFVLTLLMLLSLVGCGSAPVSEANRISVPEFDVEFKVSLDNSEVFQIVDSYFDDSGSFCCSLKELESGKLISSIMVSPDDEANADIVSIISTDSPSDNPNVCTAIQNILRCLGADVDAKELSSALCQAEPNDTVGTYGEWLVEMSSSANAIHIYYEG